MLRTKINRILPVSLSALFLASLSLFSCKKADDTAGTAQFIGEWRGTGCDEHNAMWTEKAPMFSLGRSQAVAFSLNDMVYVAGGHQKKDFWQYSPATNLWTQLPDVPGTSFWRKGAVGFAVNGFGFVGLGLDAGNVYMQDMFKYDPSTNIWSAVSPFPGFPRTGAFSFVVGDTVFIGGGTDASGQRLGDLFAYIEATDTWLTRAYLPTTGVSFCSAFAYGHDGYITCGVQNDGVTNATYKYNPRSDKWTQVASFPGSPRYGTAAFVIGSKAYCGTGLATGDVLQQDMYIYDMSNNTWANMDPYPGGTKYLAVAASLNSKGYLGTGADLSTHFSNWYQYTPKSSNSLTYTITKGPDNTSVYLKYKIATDTCAQEVSILGTVSSNTLKDNFSMNSQTFVDKCGNNYSISGGASLRNDSIFITTLQSSKDGTTACTFKGAK